MAKPTAKRKTKTSQEIIDYIALIERQALVYGVSRHYIKHTQQHPHRRTLTLYGRLVHPKKLHGRPIEFVLLGDRPLTDEPEDPITDAVGALSRQGDGLLVVAHVPPDFIPALSSALHDGRLDLAVSRGPPLQRKSCALIGLNFYDKAFFEEENWGEALPPLIAENF